MERALDTYEFRDRVQEVVLPLQREAFGGLAPDSVIHRVRLACDRFESPLVRWEHALQPVVLLAIVPLFALANAGVAVSSNADGISLPVATGVALGLLLGKPIGITLFAWAAVRLKWARLPRHLTWSRLHASSWLAGIGFTMSLFISGLALEGSQLHAARIGLLVASACAAIIGSLLLWRTCPPLLIDAPARAQSGEPERRDARLSEARVVADGV
jgi:NhaA family Na+:H+ antiporter